MMLVADESENSFEDEMPEDHHDEGISNIGSQLKT